MRPFGRAVGKRENGERRTKVTFGDHGIAILETKASLLGMGFDTTLQELTGWQIFVSQLSVGLFGATQHFPS